MGFRVQPSEDDLSNARTTLFTRGQGPINESRVSGSVQSNDNVEQMILYVSFTSSSVDSYSYSDLIKISRNVLNNLASSYLELPPASNVTKEAQVRKMLRTARARAAEPDSVARAELLGQFITEGNEWTRDSDKFHLFKFSNESMLYKKGSKPVFLNVANS